MELTIEMLDELENLALAATPDLWVVDPLGNGSSWSVETSDGEQPIALCQPISGDRLNLQRNANAKYIAAANPQKLLAIISKLRAYDAHEAK